MPAPSQSHRTRRVGPFIAVGFLAAVVGAWLTSMPSRRRRLDLRGAVALVIGGSRGLGLELARELGRRGARVAICARDRETLERARRNLEHCGVEALALPCDVTDQAATADTVQAVREHWGRLDILVNNAGVIQVGPITRMTIDDFRQALAVNFWGPLHATFAALPLMRAQGSGRIVNIVSIGGKVSAPHLAPYSASKFALAGWSEALHAELAAEGIRVTTVYPGLMRTGSPRHALFKGSHRVEFAWFSIADALPLLSISVRRAARRIISAGEHGAPSLVLPLPAKLAAWAPALLPVTTARVLALVSRLLPGGGALGTTPRRGRESESAWSPSILTTLGERAARTQNQLG
jgi:NAD(P)-dependent dehydrogenase (short-subunit alcohol dehydrogenase family)